MASDHTPPSHSGPRGVPATEPGLGRLTAMADDLAPPEEQLQKAPAEPALDAGPGLSQGPPAERERRRPRVLALAFVLALGLLGWLRVSGVDGQLAHSVGNALHLSIDGGCGGP